MFLIKEIIRKKRDKALLSQKEIQFFIDGVTNNTVTNEQISAMTMAILLNDLSLEERKNITLSMRNSGEVLSFPNLTDKPIVDKHSTGGVGDLVSIPLAPLVAACGAYVPMITGKGLGHTGGTTDKMNSIPYYNTTPSNDIFKKTVQDCGCAIIGQTQNLAPADKRIYAVRDTTATVESIPLIASSILSKKLASGISYLIMDIKSGTGAFMTTHEKATELARTIVDIAKSVKVPTKALITDMNESLSRNIGNALEIKESIEYLTGKSKDSKLHEIIMALASNMLMISGISSTEEESYAKLNHALISGKAAEIFEKMVASLGGDSNILTNYNKVLPKSKLQKPIYLRNSGFIQDMDARELGLILVHLGGGRKKSEDILDLSVGLENVAKIGEEVSKSQPFAILHYQEESQYQQIEEILNNIIKLGDTKDNIRSIKNIYEVIS